MSLFSEDAKPFVGVDIGPSSIKVVELSAASGRGPAAYRLERCGMGATPPGTMDGRHVTKAKELGAAVKETLKSAGIKTRRAAVAVASSSVITKVLALPKGMGDRELEALVQLEADQYIPYALEEVKIDFEILGPSRIAPDSVDVLLAASHSENVDELGAAVQAAGLDLALVDVESFAIRNACEQLTANWPLLMKSDTAVAVVDLGSLTTTVMVTQSGQVVYSRDQNIGGGRLTEEIQARYGLDAIQAEKAKCVGNLPNDYAQTVRRPFVEALAQEIRSALQFYYSAGAGEDVRKVFLTGGGAALPELAATLQESGISAEVVDPFAGMTIAPRINTTRLKESASSYVVACGLALRSVGA